MNDIAPRSNAVVERRAAEASPDVIAKVLVEGFDRHYALFRECARAAKRYFEAGNWLAIGHVAGDRIDFYDRRVAETVERIERDFRFGDAGGGDDAFWAQVKRRFIGLPPAPNCGTLLYTSDPRPWAEPLGARSPA